MNVALNKLWSSKKKNILSFQKTQGCMYVCKCVCVYSRSSILVGTWTWMHTDPWGLVSPWGQKLRSPQTEHHQYLQNSIWTWPMQFSRKSPKGPFSQKDHFQDIICVYAFVIPGSLSSCERIQVWWVGRFPPATRSSRRRGDAPEESLWFPGSKPASPLRPPKSEDWRTAAQTPQESKTRC